MDNDGNILAYEQAFENPEIINFAHDNGVKTMAVVANLPDYSEGGDWDWKRVDEVINSPSSRQIHILNLLDLVKERDFDGVTIDYEALRRQQRDDFSLFIEELSRVFHENDKIVGVAIHPKTSENNPQEKNGSQAQDLIKLSVSADQLYFMTYGEHDSSTGPGPISSLGWMEQVYGFAINDLGVDSQKIFVGLPLYGHDWPLSSIGSVGGPNFADVKNLIEKASPTIYWNEEAGEAFFEYSDEKDKRIVWYNDADSITSKLKLVKQFKTGGVAFWRLGGEDQDIWAIFQEQ